MSAYEEMTLGQLLVIITNCLSEASRAAIHGRSEGQLVRGTVCTIQILMICEME